jgi:hypothetical protein
MFTMAATGAYLRRRRHVFDLASGRWMVRPGLVAAVLALVVQLTAPFAPMRQPAADPFAPLAQAAAFWGDSALCLAPGSADGKPGSKQSSLASHDCPICQFLQQMANLVPPSAGIVLPTLMLRGHLDSGASTDPAPRLALLAARPRAPPTL